MSAGTALELLAAYLDGPAGEEDNWLVNDAYAFLHRATVGPLFTDRDREAADLAEARARYEVFFGESDV